MATDPLSTEQQSLLKQPSDNVTISRSTCKIIAGLATLFLIANIVCIAVLFSIVLDDDESSSEKRAAGSMEVAGPYTPAIEANGFLFISGQIAVVNGTVDGDITEQTEMVLQNIKDILEDAGSNMNKVVKCTVFLSNIDNFDAMNAVYMHYFNVSTPEIESYPARSAFAVRDLPLNASVEIEAFALT